jgi:hypothetical protein
MFYDYTQYGYFDQAIFRLARSRSREQWHFLVGR